jgi:uncharacterized protein with HEPN domain
MLSIKDKRIAECIIRHCLNIEEDISNITEEYFYNDRKTQKSICFDILQIGELAKSLSEEFVTEYNKMPWKDIKGMRDWVAHGYQTLKMDRVYRTAIQDIKPLREYCEQIIKEND